MLIGGLLLMMNGCEHQLTQPEAPLDISQFIPPSGPGPLPGTRKTYRKKGDHLLSLATDTTTLGLVRDFLEAQDTYTYAAIAGFWNADTKEYHYRLLPLTFPDSVVQQAGGQTRTYGYRLKNKGNGVLRKLEAIVPAAPASEALMNTWLGANDSTLAVAGARAGAHKTGRGDAVISNVPCPDGPDSGWYITDWGNAIEMQYREVATVCENYPTDDGSSAPKAVKAWPSCHNSLSQQSSPCSSGGGGGSGGGEGGGDNSSPTHHPVTQTQLESFLNAYADYFTTNQKAFIRENPWMVPYLKKYIQNRGLQPDPGATWPKNMGPIGKFIMDIAFNNPESAQFFARFWKEQGDWHIPDKMFNDIVASAEKNYPSAKKNYNTNKGAYKRSFDLNGTDSKYAKGLGTFTVYYDNDDNPIGMFDKYDFNIEAAKYRDYTGTNWIEDGIIWVDKTEWGFTSRGIVAEWMTRGMKGLSLLGAGKAYKIMFP